LEYTVVDGVVRRKTCWTMVMGLVHVTVMGSEYGSTNGDKLGRGCGLVVVNGAFVLLHWDYFLSILHTPPSLFSEL
jgi:hypothetical protein